MDNRSIVMYCNACGKENPDDAEFCNHCGADLANVGTFKIKPVGMDKKWTPTLKIIVGIVVIIIIVAIAAVIIGMQVSSSQGKSVITPVPTPIVTNTPVPTTTKSPPQRDGNVTIQTDKNSIFIGNPISLSGTCITGDTIQLISNLNQNMSGTLLSSGICSLDTWNYQWSTDYTFQPGSYTITVMDTTKNSYDRMTVKAEKGSVTVTVSGDRIFHVGDILTVSGTDTAGKNIEVTISSVKGNFVWYHGTSSVNSDNNWIHSLPILSITTPGSYNVTAKDITSHEIESTDIILS